MENLDMVLELVQDNQLSDAERWLQRKVGGGKTLLHIFIAEITHEQLQAILENFDLNRRNDLLTQRDREGRTPLHTAASTLERERILETSIRLLGPNRMSALLTTDKDNQNPLQVTVTRSNLEAILNSVECWEDRLELFVTKPNESSKHLELAPAIAYGIIHTAVNWSNSNLKFLVLSNIIRIYIILQRSPLTPQCSLPDDWVRTYISHIDTAFDKFRMVAILHQFIPSLADLLNVEDYKQALYDEDNNVVTDDNGNSILHVLAESKNLLLFEKIIILLDNDKIGDFLDLENKDGKLPQDLIQSDCELKQFLEWVRKQRESNCYYFPKPPCCLIIYSKLNRPQAGREKNALSKGLRRLGLKPRLRRARQKQDILDAIADVKDEPFTTGLIVAIMCHGNNNGVVAENDERVFITSILKEMGASVPEDKPKMLWIQACNRRDNQLSTVNEREHDVYSAPTDMGPQQMELPGSNFHVIYATLSGDIAWRNHMIRKLAQVLKKLKVDEDMSLVFKRLAKLMKKDSDQIPIESATCPGHICLKNVYSSR